MSKMVYCAAALGGVREGVMQSSKDPENGNLAMGRPAGK